MTYRSQHPLDDTDWRLLAELQRDARLSFNELGRRIHLSAPSVADRVRRLESTGVITGYHATVDAARAGQPVSAFIQMRCERDHCLLKTSRASDYPEVVEIHKLSGDYCSMLRVRTTSMQHLESLLERLGKHGAARSAVVMSTQFAGRPVEPADDIADDVTSSAGWSGAK